MSESKRLMKKCGLAGAVAGLALFAVGGLLQGAAIGGTGGLLLVKHLFGGSTLALMADELLPRVIIGASMLVGVAVSCIAFVTAGAVLGTAGGYILNHVTGRKRQAEGVYAPAKAVMSGDE